MPHLHDSRYELIADEPYGVWACDDPYLPAEQLEYLQEAGDPDAWRRLIAPNPWPF